MLSEVEMEGMGLSEEREKIEQRNIYIKLNEGQHNLAFIPN